MAKQTQQEIREKVVAMIESFQERQAKGIEIPESEQVAYFNLLRKVKSM